MPIDGGAPERRGIVFLFPGFRISPGSQVEPDEFPHTIPGGQPEGRSAIIGPLIYIHAGIHEYPADPYMTGYGSGPERGRPVIARDIGISMIFEQELNYILPAGGGRLPEGGCPAGVPPVRIRVQVQLFTEILNVRAYIDTSGQFD